jgi:hypothetical protein
MKIYSGINPATVTKVAISWSEIVASHKITRSELKGWKVCKASLTLVPEHFNALVPKGTVEHNPQFRRISQGKMLESSNDTALLWVP